MKWQKGINQFKNRLTTGSLLLLIRLGYAEKLAKFYRREVEKVLQH